MSDTVFRTQTEQITKTEPVIEASNQAKTDVTNIEVPYLDYETSHSHPYLVDHFHLGDTWNDVSGGFPREIAQIEGYIEGKIKMGEVANSVTAIKDMIKSLEKITNMTKEERAVVKIETLSAYVEFLQKTERTKSNIRRYAY